MLNWFYSFSLNKLSLICFCKKKKVWKYGSTRPDPIDPFKNDPFWPVTRLTRQLNWPTRTRPDPTQPFCHVSSQNQMLWEFSNFCMFLFWGWVGKLVWLSVFFWSPHPKKKNLKFHLAITKSWSIIIIPISEKGAF